MLLKRILAGLLCLVILAGAVYFGCTFRFFDRALSEEAQEEFKASISLPDNFTLTASADCADAPRNSLQAIRSAVDDGAYAVELNIAFDENAVPYLADGADFITPQSVPLETVLEKSANRTYLRYILALHNFAPADVLYGMLQKYNMLERVILCGFTADTIQEQRNNYSRFRLCMDIGSSFTDPENEEICRQLQSDAFNAGVSFLRCSVANASATLSSTLRSGTIGLILDHVETEYDMYNALSMNPGVVITTHPKELYHLLFENGYIHARMESPF